MTDYKNSAPVGDQAAIQAAIDVMVVARDAAAVHADETGAAWATALVHYNEVTLAAAMLQAAFNTNCPEFEIDCETLYAAMQIDHFKMKAKEAFE
jgi:selenophosphate synthetase-related protein